MLGSDNISHVAWNEVCIPKEVGGLGIRLVT